MVVISELPMLSIGVMQERVGSPPTCTVQAPHSAMPQPNFVPVMPSTSRSTQRSGVSPSTSTLCVLPLTLMVKAIAFLHVGCQIGSILMMTSPCCRSPLPVCRENVILFLHDRVARIPAVGPGSLRRERVGRAVIVELGVSPSAAVREALAVLHHEVDVMQDVRNRRRSRGLFTLLRLPMDLRHLG